MAPARLAQQGHARDDAGMKDVGGTKGDVGVYVHVPFCERVCPYCDFAVVAARTLPREDEDRYVEALLQELEQRASPFEGRALASLYLGGGTPSLLHPDSLARIVRAVAEAFPKRNEPVEAGKEPVEVTLEVNPSTLERERLPGFREAGVTRVSLGVQSFHDPVLQKLGRAHRANEGRHTLAACNDTGFESVSIDLIFAAPGQSRADFAADLEEALSFAPAHVSTYELTIEPGTPFALAASRGQLGLARKDEREEDALAMVEAAEAVLGAAGLARYEISNYARPGFESRHNRRYWERRPVLGIGVGAFSNDPASEQTPFGVRRSNRRDLAGYLEALAAGKTPEAGPPEVLDAPTARAEAVFLALRASNGLDAAEFAVEFGAAPRAFFGAAIDELLTAGLLEELGGESPGDLRLTARGKRLSDSVFERFV
jgi:oxygen-independent coproporphyrinogen-3 oxidase